MICKFDRTALVILDEALKKLNINRSIEVIIVEGLGSPAIDGIINPKILLPLDIVKNINDNELAYILLHELCHYKRKDVLIGKILFLFKSIYWFNPIIVFALKTIRNDCEIASDNMVISMLDRKERLYYGYTIINMVKYISRSNLVIAAVSMASTKKVLRERIKMIGEGNKFKSKKRLIIGIGFVCILSLVSLSSGKGNVEAKIKNSNDNENILLNNITNNADVIVYNSHVDEGYSDNYSVIDGGILLTKNLTEAGIKSEFLQCKITSEYSRAYENSKEAINESFDDYSESIFIDVHRGIEEAHENKITFVLVEDEINYNSNLELINKVVLELNNQEIETVIATYPSLNIKLNQELGKAALTIDIGSMTTSEEEVNKLVESLSRAISKSIK